jgi:signal transduction histidine kinase
VLLNEKLAATGRLAANVAHEINNPLFAISNAIQVIKKERSGDSPEAGEVIALAEREIRRVRGITRDLYEFTRLRWHGFKPVDLSAVLASAVQALHWGGALGDLRVTVTPERGAFPLLGDGDGLQQVFMNLLRNSGEAMGGIGTVAVSVGEEAECWAVHVRDQGPGFAPEIKARLFEPFNSSKDVKGVGLGLYISFQIVSRHHGSLALLDEPGGGAHFVVRLPKAGESDG